MKHLTLIITIALLIVIGYAFYTAVDTFAASDNTVSICDTVDANGTAAYNGHSVDTLDANSRHCTVDGEQAAVTHKHNDTVSNHAVVTVNHDAPVIVTHDTNKHVKTHKACNNGEGNGSEGCSPAKSDNANNDENHTTPKQDKSNK